MDSHNEKNTSWNKQQSWNSISPFRDSRSQMTPVKRTSLVFFNNIASAVGSGSAISLYPMVLHRSVDQIIWTPNSIPSESSRTEPIGHHQAVVDQQHRASESRNIHTCDKPLVIRSVDRVDSDAVFSVLNTSSRQAGSRPVPLRTDDQPVWWCVLQLLSEGCLWIFPILLLGIKLRRMIPWITNGTRTTHRTGRDTIPASATYLHCEVMCVVLPCVREWLLDEQIRYQGAFQLPVKWDE